MRAVLQRVNSSRVEVNGKVVGSIGKGLNILLGVKKGDTYEDLKKLAKKAVNLRIFENEEGKFHFSLLDVKGEALVVSQFTLYANTKKGKRPSFEEAEEPARAKELYEAFIEELKALGVPKVESGIFGAMMEVYIQNWGPVTLVLDSEKL